MSMEPKPITYLRSSVSATPGSPEVGELAGRWIIQQIDDGYAVDLHQASSVVNGSISSLKGFTIVTLNLAGQYNLTDDAIKEISTISTITVLNISGLRILSTTALSHLKSLNLGTLDISGCDQIISLEPLAAFSHLSELNISRCPKLHDNEIDFLKHVPLETLRVRSCSGLSAAGTLSRLSGHPTLKTLDISNNRFWKQDAITTFQQNNPNISVIK